MEVQNSYNDLYLRAEAAITLRKREEATVLLRRLLDRLLSLPAHILERKPDLQKLLAYAAREYVAMLRWGGQNEEALAAIDHFHTILPNTEPAWTLERALNRIDSGRASEGLDLLRALVLHPRRTSWTLRTALARELMGAGQYEEAERIGTRLLRDAPDDASFRMALRLLLDNAIQMGNAQAVIRYAETIAKRADILPVQAYEWLAGRGYWDQLERQIEKGLCPDGMERVFGGEIRRARGDESGARKIWQSIFDSVEDDVGRAGNYAHISAELLLGRASQDTVNKVLAVSALMPEDSVSLLMFVAALVQMGRIEDALTRIREYIQLSRLFRPFYRVLPHSHWLRLRRYPVPNEAVDALRPYFAAEQAKGAA